MKNNHTPEIRFPGYTGDWDQRKLGDIFNILDGDRGKNYPGESDFNDDGATLFLDTGNVKKNGFDFSTKKYITKEKDESLRSGKLELHDFVLTSRGTLGNVAYYDEKTRNNNPSVRINSAMLILRPAMNNQVSDDYMAAVLRGNIIDTFMLTNHVGSAQPHITKRDFSKVSIGIPSILEEQTKIGSFFKRLDKTIALHQQELTTFKQTKQGFLQKMFPKEEESVPEVRFPGFSGDWKQHKLKDIAVFNPKSVLPEQFEYVDLESVVGTNLISHRTEHRESAPSRAQRLAKQGDVFYQTVRPYQKNNYLFDLPYDNYVFSTGYAQMRPNVDSYFLFSKLQEEKFVSSVLDRCTGTSYPAINSNDLAQIEVRIPTLEEEQIKIGNFFKQLDDTISLHHRELEALKETKKAFLQKMFV
ncbi:restriction endonuclease subunit S [Bacillus cereus]